jgi:hypothetical protein
MTRYEVSKLIKTLEATLWFTKFPSQKRETWRPCELMKQEQEWHFLLVTLIWKVEDRYGFPYFLLVRDNHVSKKAVLLWVRTASPFGWHLVFIYAHWSLMRITWNRFHQGGVNHEPCHTTGRHKTQRTGLPIRDLCNPPLRKFQYRIAIIISGLGRFSISWSYTVGRTPWTGYQPVTRPLPTHRINAQNRHIHASSGIRIHDPGVRASEDSSCLRPRGHCDRQYRNMPAQIWHSEFWNI